MANASKGMIIYDEQIESAKKTIVRYSQELLDMIAEYCACMENITETAIKDARIRQRLVNLTSKMIAVQEPIENVAQNVEKQCKNYLAEIDAADDFLY